MSYEDDDFRKIYEHIDWVKNTEQAEINGEEKLVLLPSFEALGLLLSTMEAMAREIEFGKGSVGFEIKPDRWGNAIAVPKGNTMHYFLSLQVFLRDYAYLKRNVYSLHVQAVCAACEALKLDRHFFFWMSVSPEPYDGKKRENHQAAFNDIVVKIAEIVGSSQFREKLRIRERNAERNEEKGLAIEQKVFEGKGRWLVLMLHLGYDEKYRGKITLEEIQKHRMKLFNNCRSNKQLRGIVDYIWKLEEGDESGLHLHVLIFYTSDSCRDVYIAKQIGEYWKRVVTGGKGKYWNSNADKWFHAKYGHGIGTGEINWDDDEKREALRENIRYMTKADQFLKMKYGKHCHLFGTSQPQEKKKAGRPRKHRRDPEA